MGRGGDILRLKNGFRLRSFLFCIHKGMKGCLCFPEKGLKKGSSDARGDAGGFPQCFIEELVDLEEKRPSLGWINGSLLLKIPQGAPGILDQPGPIGSFL